MKKNLSDIFFIFGLIILILPVILIFIINKEIVFATKVLSPLGGFLLLLGSIWKDKNDDVHLD